jgi:prevent-host-death family protein
MPKKSYGAKEARTLLPELIERAHRGERSVITKQGKPYAQVVPVDSNTNSKPRFSFLSLAGTGRGYSYSAAGAPAKAATGGLDLVRQGEGGLDRRICLEPLEGQGELLPKGAQV